MIEMGVNLEEPRKEMGWYCLFFHSFSYGFRFSVNCFFEKFKVKE